MNTCQILLNDQPIFSADSLQNQLFACAITATDIKHSDADEVGPIHLMVSANPLPKQPLSELDPESLKKEFADSGRRQQTKLQVGDRIVIHLT
jgi:hypothetical protein